MHLSLKLFKVLFLVSIYLRYLVKMYESRSLSPRQTAVSRPLLRPRETPEQGSQNIKAKLWIYQMSLLHL